MPARRRTPAADPAATPDEHPAGPIETAVESLVSALEPAEMVPGHDVFAAQALNLARVLDSGTAALAIAAVHRELRELITTMTDGGGGDEDSPTRELLARLSAPLGHTAN